MEAEVLKIYNELQKKPSLFSIMKQADEVKNEVQGVTNVIHFLNKRKLQEAK